MREGGEVAWYVGERKRRERQRAGPNESPKQDEDHRKKENTEQRERTREIRREEN